MKLRVANPSGANDPSVTFAPDGTGVLSAIVNVKPDGANGAMALNKVSTITSAETSKGGVRRVLVRVEMPYMALDPASLAGSDTNLVYSPTRSGRKISVHCVITLPREAVEDLRGQRVGTPGVKSAAGQVSMLANILMGILQQLGVSVADPTAMTTDETRWCVGGVYYVPSTNVLGPVEQSSADTRLLGIMPSDVVAAQSLVARALLGSVPLDAEATLGKIPAGA
jgi:hypothetical protein